MITKKIIQTSVLMRPSSVRFFSTKTDVVHQSEFENHSEQTLRRDSSVLGNKLHEVKIPKENEQCGKEKATDEVFTEENSKSPVFVVENHSCDYFDMS